MYSREALLDMHSRVHKNLAGLIAHCAKLSPEDAERKLEAFGDATIRLQIHHAIGAEKYWMGVLQGVVDAADTSGDYPDVASLEAFRIEVFQATREFLNSLDEEALNGERRVSTWGGHEADLRPSHVFLRTQTHYYQHQGQVLAACRLLGHPGSGFDFPIR
ncbi:DinB family protein [bacterium]|nr:DinB family protein [bacterium]